MEAGHGLYACSGSPVHEQDRPPHLVWSADEEAFITQQARSMPQIGALLPSADTELVNWMTSSLAAVGALITRLRWLGAAQPESQPWYKRWLAAKASVAPTNQDEAGTLLDEQHRDEETRSYLDSVIGAEEVCLEVLKWRAGMPRGKDTARDFLSERRALYGLSATGETDPRFRCLNDVADLVMDYDHDCSGQLHNMELERVIEQLDLPLEMPRWTTPGGTGQFPCLNLYRGVREALQNGSALRKRKVRGLQLRRRVSGLLMPQTRRWRLRAESVIATRARCAMRGERDERSQEALRVMTSARREAEWSLVLADAVQNTPQPGQAPLGWDRCLQRESLRLGLLEAARKRTFPQESGGMSYVFELFDPEDTGYLDLCLLPDVLAWLGAALGPTDLRRARQEMDPAHSGMVARGEFEKWYAGMLPWGGKTFSSRVVRVQRAVGLLRAGGRFRRGAQVLLTARCRREWHRKTRQCLELIEGNYDALDAFLPWHRRTQPILVPTEHEVGTLMKHETAATADGLCFMTATELGGLQSRCVELDLREADEARELAAGPERGVIKRVRRAVRHWGAPNREHEEAVVAYCRSLFTASPSLSVHEAKYWLDLVSHQLGISPALSSDAWRQAVDFASTMRGHGGPCPLDWDLLNKSAEATPALRGFLGRWWWYCLRRSSSLRFKRGNELVTYLVNQRAMARTLGGFESCSPPPSPPSVDVRLTTGHRLVALAQDLGHERGLAYMTTVAGRRAVKDLAAQLASRYPHVPSSDSDGYALDILTVGLQDSISVLDVPMVLRVVLGSSTGVDWLSRFLLDVVVAGDDFHRRVSVTLLRAICDRAPRLVERQPKAKARRSFMNYAKLFVLLRFRARERDRLKACLETGCIEQWFLDVQKWALE
jgi:hypothetical protein